MHIPAIAKGKKNGCQSCQKLWHCHKTKFFRGETVCRAEAHLKVKRKQLNYSKYIQCIYVKKYSTLLFRSYKLKSSPQWGRSEYWLPRHQKVGPNICEGSIFWNLLNISDYLFIFWLLIVEGKQAPLAGWSLFVLEQFTLRQNSYTKVKQRICNKNLPWSLSHCLFEEAALLVIQ